MIVHALPSISNIIGIRKHFTLNMYMYIVTISASIYPSVSKLLLRYVIVHIVASKVNY